MILLDSSCWITYLTEGALASSLEKYIAVPDKLVVPSLVIYEVYRQLIKKVETEEALLAVSQMEKGIIVPLSVELSMYAAELSLKHRLGMADAIIYATALIQDAELITQDNDFRSLPHCQIINRKS